MDPLRGRPLRAFNDGAPGVHGFGVYFVFRRNAPEQQPVAFFGFHRDLALRALAPRAGFRNGHVLVYPLAIRKSGLATEIVSTTKVNEITKLTPSTTEQLQEDFEG